MDEVRIPNGERCDICCEPIRDGERVMLVPIGGGFSWVCERDMPKALLDDGTRAMESESVLVAIGYMPRCDDPGAHRPGCRCDGGEPRL